MASKRGISQRKFHKNFNLDVFRHFIDKGGGREKVKGRGKEKRDGDEEQKSVYDFYYHWLIV